MMPLRAGELIAKVTGRDKGVRTLADETLPCPWCRNPVEVVGVRKMKKAPVPGEYETKFDLRKPDKSQKHIDGKDGD